MQHFRKLKEYIGASMRDEGRGFDFVDQDDWDEFMDVEYVLV